MPLVSSKRSSHQPPPLRAVQWRIWVAQFWVSLLLLCAITVAGTWFLFGVISEREQALVDDLALHTTHYMGEAEEVTRIIAATLASLPPAERATFLEQSRAQHPRFLAFTMVGSEGQVLAETDEAQTLLGLDLSGNPTFRQVRYTNSFATSSPFFSVSNNMTVLPVAAPIIQGDRFQGVLIGDLSLAHIEALLGDERLHIHSTPFIMDEFGTLIAHPHMSWVEQRRNLQANLPSFKALSQPGIHIFWDEEADAWAIGSARKTAEGWLVMTTAPLLVAFRPALILLLTGAVIITIASFSLVSIQNRSLKQIDLPISALTTQVSALAHGQRLPDEALPATFEELHVLRTRFAEAAQEVQDHIGELQHHIGELKRTEAALRESEQRYRALFEESIDGVILGTPDGQILSANPAACHMFDLSEAELIAMGQRGIINDDQPGLREAFAERERTGRFRGELLMRREDGSLFPAEISSVIFVDPAGAYRSSIIVRDITARREAELRLRASLREKEMLLQEVHHRVKNNLQIISSLLRLQARGVSDPEFQEILREGQNRIRSMGLIHEMLYQSGNLAWVSAGSYLRQLQAHLLRAYGEARHHVTIRSEVDPKLHLDLDVAIPCGLIINELVSNALKYAFPDERTGTIIIALALADEGRLRLSVTDDGVGIPAEGAPPRPGSLGLELVASLARQLQGTLTTSTEGGTSYSLSFPFH